MLQLADICVDVGAGDYDHHMPGGNGQRDNGVPFASAGLVWRDFGDKVVRLVIPQAAENGTISQIANLVDQRLIQPIDQWDNGQRGESEDSFARVISAMNPFTVLGEELSNDDEFSEAVNYAELALLSIIRQAAAEAIGDHIVCTAEKPCAKLLVLPEFIPGLVDGGLDKFPQHEDVSLLVYPTQGSYRIHVRKGCQLLPESWLDAEWKQQHGSVVFVHPQRFIAGVNDLEAAQELARLALEG
jgi:uncharacterized UPF0160 family protein